MLRRVIPYLYRRPSTPLAALAHHRCRGPAGAHGGDTDVLLLEIDAGGGEVARFPNDLRSQIAHSVLANDRTIAVDAMHAYAMRNPHGAARAAGFLRKAPNLYEFYGRLKGTQQGEDSGLKSE